MRSGRELVGCEGRCCGLGLRFEEGGAGNSGGGDGSRLLAEGTRPPLEVGRCEFLVDGFLRGGDLLRSSVDPFGLAEFVTSWPFSLRGKFVIFPDSWTEVRLLLVSSALGIVAGVPTSWVPRKCASSEWASLYGPTGPVMKPVIPGCA